LKILWVKSGGLFPQTEGGRIRSFNIASELAKRHDVEMFTFYSRLSPDPHSGLREPFSRVECVPLDLPERASIPDMLAYSANSLTLQPYQIRKYCRPEVTRRLRQTLKKHRYDVILCDYLVTAGVLPWDTQTPTIIFTHNVEAVIWRRHFLVNQNPLWKLIAWREYRTIARAERRLTTMADHVLTVSDEDRKSFLSFLPAEKVTTIPTGVNLDYFRPAESPSSGHSLVFTGSMDWFPNDDAIIYFMSEVLPLVQKHVPDVTLTVVGRKPSRKLLTMAENNPALRVTGIVDDIRPYVHNAAVYVVPLRIGGGTRIKIFEAMAMGAATVSTSVGAEGLPVEHGKNILLADSPADFADRTVSLLRQASERERIGRAARALVESRYGWSPVTDVLETVLMQVTNSKETAVTHKRNRIADPAW
jgi:polysaccharide biosynthesis protein PslH